MRVGPTVGLPPDLLGDLVARAGRADFARFEAQLRSSNYCARPVRLTGHVQTCEPDGVRRRVWSTDAEPDGILRKACGNRREAICPSCAERYRYDARHLIGAGLRGGKGIPKGVAEHPALFVTLTAPSFGVVHTRRYGPDGSSRRCRPRRDAPVCEHGVRLSCGQVHDEQDPCLGQPLCVECFDHEGAVVWNNALSELWRRTTIYLPRILARLTAMTQQRLKRRVRFSYIKVAEYQQRGLIHLHVIIRLDRAMPTYRSGEIRAPGRRFTGQLLEEAIRVTATKVDAPLSQRQPDRRVRWGSELDVRALDLQTRAEVAGYLAKYATKSTESAGGVLHRVSEGQVDQLQVSSHVRCLLRAAFTLNEDPELRDRRLARNAHAFGFRGHCLTKSRYYSTTFKALRQAREHYVHQQLLRRSNDAAERERAAAAINGGRIATFRYVGHGHLTAADAFLAASAAARAREERQAAREERSSALAHGWTGSRDSAPGPGLDVEYLAGGLG